MDLRNMQGRRLVLRPSRYQHNIQAAVSSVLGERLHGDSMTPLLTDDEISDVLIDNMPLTSPAKFARTIEQAVMRKAYQRAAKVCLERAKAAAWREDEVAGMYLYGAILKLMEEE